MKKTTLPFYRPLFIASLVLLLLCSSKLSAQSTDTLYFSSGLTLSGELDQIKEGMISFSSDDLNDQEIERYKISTLTASSYTYRIETIRKMVYYGTLGKADSGMVKIQTAKDTLLIQLQELSQVASYDTGFFNNLSGTLALGYVFTKSAQLGVLNTYNDLTYFDGTFGAELSVTGITGFTQGGTKRIREYVWFTPGYYITPSWQAVGLFSYQRNQELGTAKRFVEGAGISNTLLVRSNMTASIIGGLVTNQESAFQGRLRTGILEAPLILKYDLFLLNDNNFRLQLVQGVFFGLNEGGRIRGEGLVRAAYDIIDSFSINLVFYNSYDSRPPLNFFTKFDYSFVFGVGYSF
ncbi:uncharacterized protein DUF481 [Chitinophaga niastensis]|uniref:Uncharacterized protein DUF481 n=1 Tax=Chitinophaga niastensis TaxID=536980 RepID=A0A2P8HN67_CHINA|nr:DUF481 domain-containing protein [Chitinophaga niastensis]PSL47668.1 uncharacterized protein DUF481 [Chitinophaga niastensis]